MGILTRLLVFPIAFVLALFVWINGSEAENISCKRLSNVNKVFPTEKMFNDWFPSEIQLEINKWVAVKGKEFLEKVDKKRRFTLYKNGSMRARVLPGQTDIHSGQTFNYKCNSNGFRVAQQNLNIEEIADKEPAKSREQSIVPNGDKQPSQNANQNTVTGLFKKIFTPSDEMLTEKRLLPRVCQLIRRKILQAKHMRLMRCGANFNGTGGVNGDKNCILRTFPSLMRRMKI